MKTLSYKGGILRHKRIQWGIKLFFLIGYLFSEFITEGKSYYHEFESLVLISVLILGTFYCNYLCPYGIISEIFEKFGKLILGKNRSKIQIPEKYDSKLRHVKYIFGIFFLGMFIWGNVDYLGDHGEMYFSNPISTVYLIVKMTLGISILSFFFDRFFCRYLCYQKVWYNIIEQISPTKIIRSNKSCTSCNLCNKSCPMNVPVSQLATIRAKKDCISCYDCVKVCPPKFGAMNLVFFRKAVNPLKFIIWSSVVYFILSWAWVIFGIENLI